jgi:glycosyltransferase involved in cell wall biosynthesis
MAMCVFLLTADRVIFTTEYERQLACKFVPWLKKKSVVIHIGSNIPFLSSPSRDIDVAYFGRICPMKGLEEFGAAIRKVNQDRKWKVLVIGHIAEGYEEYGASICKELEAVGAEVVLNGKASEVARLLSGVRIALLPFPDGMSLRRGSALAAMGNGALLLTTPSVSDASVLEGKCLIAEGAAELHETLTLALSNYSSYDRVRMAGQEFAQSCSWNAIASAYLDTINAMI